MPDLTFTKLAYGTHQVPWDLRILLYPGAAGLRRKAEFFDNPQSHGPQEQRRAPLVTKFHEVISAKLDRGGSPQSVVSQLESVWRFVGWVDTNAVDKFTIEGILEAFHSWTEALKHRVDVIKDMKAKTANDEARLVGDLVARALNHSHTNPGAALVRRTRLHMPGLRNKRVLGTQADKQNLADTFAFGHLLGDLCEALSVDVVRGPIPLNIAMSNGATLVLSSGLKTAAGSASHRLRTDLARAPLPDDVTVLDVFQRSRLLNIRIEAELLIFVAQTGFNLTPATTLRRDNYRWQTDGDDLLAFRVFKARRGGEAIFRCFKTYREHLNRYLAWLDDLGFTERDDRLFPFVYHSRIPATYALPNFRAITRSFKKIGARTFRPRALRNTRINWLLRRSQNADLTAEQAAHSKQTLLAVYEQPHHQLASVEILKFHVATDPAISPPGPGICEANVPHPIAANGTPAEAPQPDCISPEGCLFCVYHRDIESEDYCWKLACHAKLKSLELCLYKPPENATRAHPVERALDRLLAKLKAISESSAIHSEWVRNAQDAVRAGRYHPHWTQRLTLLEGMT